MSTIKPGVYNITVYERADFELDLQWQVGGVPVDLTGRAIQAQIRMAYADAQPAAIFAVSITDAAQGRFRLSLTEVQTAALGFDRYVYDVRVGPERYERLLHGIVTVSKGVTR